MRPIFNNMVDESGCCYGTSGQDSTPGHVPGYSGTDWSSYFLHENGRQNCTRVHLVIGPELVLYSVPTLSQRALTDFAGGI